MNATTQSLSTVKPAPTYSVGYTLLAGLPLFTLLPLGLDIFLPAMYQIGSFFNDQSVPAFAISIYMLFWGIGQLIWGGLADKLGKKNIALIGLIIFTLGSYLIFIAESNQPNAFLAYRAMQSFGGSACFTAIFALIRMRFDGEELNKGYSYLNGILAVIPVSAPLLGAYIVENNPWNSLFGLLVLLGAVSLVWILLAIPADKKSPVYRDTALINTTSNNSDDSNKGHSAAEAGLIRGYLSVLSNVRFRSYLLFALTGQMLFIYYLTVAPTYLIGKLGVSQMEFGQMFMIIALVFMAVSFLAPKLSQKMNIKFLIGFAFSLCVVGGVMMYGFGDILSWYSLIVPMVFIATGCTILLSSCPAHALADFKENAGVASGLYTATTFGVGALISGVFTKLVDSTDLTQVAMVYTLTSIFALAVYSRNKTIKQDSTK